MASENKPYSSVLIAHGTGSLNLGGISTEPTESSESDELFSRLAGGYTMLSLGLLGETVDNNSADLIFTNARPGAPIGGLNLPQPFLPPPIDIRHGLENPLLGAPAWYARAGAVFDWNWDRFADIAPESQPIPPRVTGVIHNLTPMYLMDPSGDLLDDGLSPGSKKTDGIPDTLAFNTLSDGRRFCSIKMNFFGIDDGALFGGCCPTALIPRIAILRPSEGPRVNAIPSGAVRESDFNHNIGVGRFGSLATFSKGRCLLTGQIMHSRGEFTWTESGRDTNSFVLDIEFHCTICYDGGYLFSSIRNNSSQTLSAKWENIACPTEMRNGSTTRESSGGAVPTMIARLMSGELSTLNLELWAGDDRANLALVITDIVGYVALGNRFKDEGRKEVRQLHFAQGRKLIEKYKGHEITTTGDGFIIAFRTVGNALNFAMEFRKNPGHADLSIRAAINTGEMDIVRNDVEGYHVDFTARIAKKIDGAGIVLSDDARKGIEIHGAKQHKRLLWTRRDDVEIKGIPGLHTIWFMNE